MALTVGGLPFEDVRLSYDDVVALKGVAGTLKHKGIAVRAGARVGDRRAPVRSVRRAASMGRGEGSSTRAG